MESGIKIIEGMRGHTSGLAIPTFVVDLPQGGGKVPLQPSYVLSQTDGELLLRNYEGHVFRYRNPGHQGSMEEAVVMADVVSNTINHLLDDIRPESKESRGTVDADRVVVRS